MVEEEGVEQLHQGQVVGVEHRGQRQVEVEGEHEELSREEEEVQLRVPWVQGGCCGGVGEGVGLLHGWELGSVMGVGVGELQREMVEEEQYLGID